VKFKQFNTCTFQLSEYRELDYSGCVCGTHQYYCVAQASVEPTNCRQDITVLRRQTQGNRGNQVS